MFVCYGIRFFTEFFYSIDSLSSSRWILWNDDMSELGIWILKKLISLNKLDILKLLVDHENNLNTIVHVVYLSYSNTKNPLNFDKHFLIYNIMKFTYIYFIFDDNLYKQIKINRDVLIE